MIRIALCVVALVAGGGAVTAACPHRQNVKAVKVQFVNAGHAAAVVVKKDTAVTTQFEVVTEVTANTSRTVRENRPTSVVVEEKKVTRFSP